MRKLQPEDRFLIWQGYNRTFALLSDRVDQAVLARISVPDTIANASAEGHVWTFEQSGAFRRKVLVRDSGTGAAVGTVSVSILGTAKLRVADGKAFVWTRHRLVERGRTLASSSGPLYCVRYRGDRLTKGPGSTVEITPDAFREPALPLLLLLGWYLIAGKIDGPVMLGRLDVEDFMEHLEDWVEEWIIPLIYPKW